MPGRPPPLLSPDWFRVAGLRPRLQPGIRTTPQTVRGQHWYVLTDPASGQHHRVNAAAQALLAGCDGRHSVDELWTRLVDSGRDDAPTQAEVIALLGQAFAAGLLHAQLPPDAQAVLQRRRGARRRQRQARLNPLAFRVPLADPDALLGRLAPAFGWLRAPGFTRWLMLLLPLALAVVLSQAADVAQALRGRFSAGAEGGLGRLALLMWLAYPLVKLLHELAHGIVIKLHGGAVHEAGLSLMMLNPVPYVDAASSAGFAGRGARVAVAAAGIVVEVLLAALALLLWRLAEPGLLQDALLAVATVAGVSTLLVNGNPLMRFDGYHVLCDAAGLPNLAVRSRLRWQLAAQALVLPGRHKARLAERLSPAPGEAAWLWLYAPLSWAWRGALLLALAAAVAAAYPAGGLLLLLLALWLSLGAPLLATLRWLAAAPELHGRRWRGALASAGAAALAALLLALPLPDRSSAPAVVWLPDDAILRAEVDGELLAYEREDGAQVQPGDLIARLDEPQLAADLATALSELAQHRIERLRHFGQDAKATGIAEDLMAQAQTRVDLLQQRRQALELRARSAGRLVIERERLPPGHHLARGEVLAHVLPPGAPLVRALVANDDIARVRERPGAVSVQLAHGDGQALPAATETAIPAASTRLPTAALGEAAGGSIATDPMDDQGLTAREPRFAVDLRLPGGTVALPGERARVVFRHGQAPLATLAGRWLRGAFLRHFER